MFVEILLPLKLAKPFTYSVDSTIQLERGQRVIVPFGKQKRYTGIVWRVDVSEPTYETKTIEGVYEDYPLVTAHQLALWEWMALHYMCSLGEVMRTALVPGLLIEGKWDSPVSEHDQVHHMLDEAKTTQEYWVQLIDKSKALSLLEASKSVRQISLLKTLIELSPEGEPISWKRLRKQAGVSTAVRQSLCEKEIIALTERPATFLEPMNAELHELKLSAAQEEVFGQIKSGFTANKPVLLKGVTGSGKTEIYMKLIEEVIGRSQQVLFLLPEIALTTELTMRINRRFPEQVLAYNSSMSSAQRVEAWEKILNQDSSVQIVVGSRSALFLPFRALGMIVVDEEHDYSYKQTDPAPRYHARDVAVYLSHLTKASVLLGSATPSIESIFNAQHKNGNEKYLRVDLNSRYAESLPTQLKLIDLREEYKRKRMHGFFSQTLLSALDSTLEDRKQILFFQNRRGYATLVSCQSCGAVKRCKHCDVGLTYHKRESLLRCHYCSYEERFTVECGDCGQYDSVAQGLGTEQIEHFLREQYPNHSVLRVDSDSSASLTKRRKALSAFEAQEYDMLVGTQMISKGIDFSNIGLVVVVQADQMLYRADYRAQEQSFQLILQVAGRGGRRSSTPALMLLQTFNPGHRVLQQLLRYDDVAFYADELKERKTFFYPPYSRMIRIQFKAKSESTVWEAASWFAKALRQFNGIEVLGNDSPIVSKIRGLHYQQIVVKYPKSISPHKLKDAIVRVQRSFESIGNFQSVRLGYHVDHI